MYSPWRIALRADCRLPSMVRGPVDRSQGSVAPAQAPLWGLGRTVALEYPDLRCVRVDLDPAARDGQAERLLEEIRADDAEGEVAIREGARYVS